MFDLAQSPCRCVTRQRLQSAAARTTAGNFQNRKFPQPAIHDTVWSLPHQELASMLQHHRYKSPLRAACALLFAWQSINDPSRKSKTVASNRTLDAFRRVGEADRRSQLHQRLIQVRARALSVHSHSISGNHELFSQVPEALIGLWLFRVFGDGKGARENANDVPIEDRLRFIERNAANGARRITSDARQFDHISKISRKGPAKFHGHDPGCILQIPRARIIAEPFPQLQNEVDVCSRKSTNVGQRLHPPLPIWNNGLDLGLLQHHLRNPDRIGIARPAPRQIARVRSIPAKEATDCLLHSLPSHNRNIRE